MIVVHPDEVARLNDLCDAFSKGCICSMVGIPVRGRGCRNVCGSVLPEKIVEERPQGWLRRTSVGRELKGKWELRNWSCSIHRNVHVQACPPATQVRAGYPCLLQHPLRSRRSRSQSSTDRVLSPTRRAPPAPHPPKARANGLSRQ